MKFKKNQRVVMIDPAGVALTGIEIGDPCKILEVWSGGDKIRVRPVDAREDHAGYWLLTSRFQLDETIDGKVEALDAELGALATKYRDGLHLPQDVIAARLRVAAFVAEKEK